MVDIKLSEILTNNPVTAALTGSEPIETVKAGTSEAFTVSQLSAAPIIEKLTSANLLATDQGKTVEMNVASANTYTIKINATTAIPIGATFLVRQMGNGTTTIAKDGGVTLLQKASSTLALSERYAQVVLQKIDTDTWHTTGEYTPL